MPAEQMKDDLTNKKVAVGITLCIYFGDWSLLVVSACLYSLIGCLPGWLKSDSILDACRESNNQNIILMSYLMRGFVCQQID